MSVTKHCKDCGEVKPRTDFFRNNRGDGRQSVCKACDYKRRGRKPRPRRMTRAEKEAAIHKLLRAYTAEADAFMDCATDAEGRFSDPEDRAEYERMTAIIDDARRALGLPNAKAAGAMDQFLGRVA